MWRLNIIAEMQRSLTHEGAERPFHGRILKADLGSYIDALRKLGLRWRAHVYK